MNNLKNSLSSFRKANAQGTINLAKQAVACGVKRFIFLSSIKVNGEKTEKSKYLNTMISKPRLLWYLNGKQNKVCGKSLKRQD